MRRPKLVVVTNALVRRILFDGARMVENRLRVRGVEGLRVIDASVMPTVTSTRHPRS